MAMVLPVRVRIDASWPVKKGFDGEARK